MFLYQIDFVITLRFICSPKWKPGHAGFRTEWIGRHRDTSVQNGADRDKPGHTGSEQSGSREIGTHRFRTEWIGRNWDTPLRTERIGRSRDTPVQNGADREKPGHTGSERSGSGETGGHIGSERSGSGHTGTHHGE